MEAMDGTNCPQCATEEPRANALKHGLTTSTCITKDSAPGPAPGNRRLAPRRVPAGNHPAIPRSLRATVSGIVARITAAGVAEQLLVADMARCAANVELHAVAATVWRQWATNAMAEFAAGCGSVPAVPRLAHSRVYPPALPTGKSSKCLFTVARFISHFSSI